MQGYGLTESTGSVCRTRGQEETFHWGATGKLSGGFEAKIISPDTGDALPPGRQGELWIRGPSIMKGKETDKQEQIIKRILDFDTCVLLHYHHSLTTGTTGKEMDRISNSFFSK